MSLNTLGQQTALFLKYPMVQLRGGRVFACKLRRLKLKQTSTSAYGTAKLSKIWV